LKRIRKLIEKNNEIRRANWGKPEEEQQELILALEDEPALFYREMVEAGILGIIQKSGTAESGHCMTVVTWMT
jgi:hypothetical protein